MMEVLAYSFSYILVGIFVLSSFKTLVDSSFSEGLKEMEDRLGRRQALEKMGEPVPPEWVGLETDIERWKNAKDLIILSIVFFWVLWVPAALVFGKK